MGTLLVLEKTVPVAVPLVGIHILPVNVMDQGIISRVSIRFHKAVPNEGILVKGIPDHFPEYVQFLILQVIDDGGELLVFMGFGSSLFHQRIQEATVLFR
jgi:hypothetical protein